MVATNFGGQQATDRLGVLSDYRIDSEELEVGLIRRNSLEAVKVSAKRFGMPQPNTPRDFKTSAGTIRLTLKLNVRFGLEAGVHSTLDK